MSQWADVPGTSITSRKTGLDKDCTVHQPVWSTGWWSRGRERNGHKLVWSKIVEVLSQANIETITTERSARCAIKLSSH